MNEDNQKSSERTSVRMEAKRVFCVTAARAGAYSTPEEALKRLDAGRGGLTPEQVEERREQYGANEISHEKPPAWYATLSLVPDAVQWCAVCSQRRFAVHGRYLRRAGRPLIQNDHRPERDGSAQHAAAVLAGISLQQGGRRAEGDGDARPPPCCAPGWQSRRRC